jgi:Uma2 family endonuclease
VLLHGVSWDVYVQLGEDNPGLRLTYLDGELEIMSPSDHHELDKTMLARLLEAYADERDLELNGFGNTTFRKRAKKRGLEPDECYVLRPLQGPLPRRPDLAIEVVLTSWQIDKLEVYRGLGVPEVWVWRGGAIQVHVLGQDRYERRERSALLPELDLVRLASFVRRRDQVRAVREYRRGL